MFSEIIQHPNDATVFLSESAVFTCVTRGGQSGWLVSGTLLEELEQNSPEIRSDIQAVSNTSAGMTMETLTILARAQYNGTRFQCAVLTFSGSARSDNATLTIQGKEHLAVSLVYLCKSKKSTEMV